MKDERTYTPGESLWAEIGDAPIAVEVVGFETFQRGGHPVMLCIRLPSGELRLWNGQRFDTYEECAQERVARLLDDAQHAQRAAMDTAEVIKRHKREQERKGGRP